MSFIKEDISWIAEDKSICIVKKIGLFSVFESETTVFDQVDEIDEEIIPQFLQPKTDLGGMSKRDFVLHHFNLGKKAKEIASIYGLNLGSVQTFIAKRPK